MSDVLKRVIDKYEISEPVPEEVRRVMEISRKKNMTEILKEQGAPLYITAAAAFFLWIKKFGISLSITKSAIVLFTAVAISAGAVTTAAVITVKKIIEYNAAEESVVNEKVIGENTVEENTVESIKKEKVIIPDKQVHSRSIISYTFALESADISAGTGIDREQFTDRAMKILNRHKSNNAVSIDMLDKYNTSDKILTLSVIKLKDKNNNAKEVYRISGKVISMANSKLLLQMSESARTENEIYTSLNVLLDRIAGSI